MDKNLDIVPLSRLKKIIQAAEENSAASEDPMISFEFLVGSCFPNVFHNVQDALKQAHCDGYRQGLEDGKKK